MLQQILDMVRAWDIWGQVLFVIITASLGTVLGMTIAGIIGQFINHTLPILIRGHSSSNTKASDDKEE
jgi:hypothetical protein